MHSPVWVGGGEGARPTIEAGGHRRHLEEDRTIQSVECSLV